MTKRLDSKSTTVSLDIRVPMVLKQQLKREAKEAGIKLSEHARNKLAVDDSAKVPLGK